jgi:hypothetical protein
MAIRVNGVKSSRLSEDNKEVIVAGTGKYTGDLELRFACECVDDLINALMKARSVAQPAVAPAAVPPNAPPLVSKQVSPAAAGNNPDEVRFEVPRNFAITADTSGRGMVLFIVNHKLERQAGYAFSPDAAKQLAGGLVKSADALLSSPATVPKN